jgi:uncharacterized protein
MDPVKIIEEYYRPESRAYHFLVHHSRMVAGKALNIAQRIMHLKPDSDFIHEAAMLHDIGIFFTNEPAIGCHGDKAYICHGYLGRELLEKAGFPKYGLVCERHVGVGISLEDIVQRNLPLPRRDMVPLTLEEQIICFADKFFSKDTEILLKEKPLERVRKEIAKFGDEKLSRFDEWLKLFGNP